MPHSYLPENQTPQSMLHACMCSASCDTSRKPCRSRQWTFTTLPEVGTRARLRIGVFGDLGQTAYSAQTLQHLAAESPQIILNMGESSAHCVTVASWTAFCGTTDLAKLLSSAS